jgi:glycine/D-amino acid oxidase-like deaminating enzyme
MPRKSKTVPAGPDTGGLTLKRDLRTGRPIWLASRMPPTAHRAFRAGKAEIVVIGAGISGALVTDALLLAGHDVTVLERRRPVQGSTAASTALLQFEIDTPLLQLSRKIGKAKAIRAYWRSASGVDYLRHRIMELEIDCDFAERETLYLAGDVLNATALKREVAARQKVGLRSIFLDRAELKSISGIDRAGASLSRGSGELNPVKLTAGLWRSAAARGAVIFAPVEVADLVPRRAGVDIRMTDGRSIAARAVVIATGYETPHFLKIAGHKIISTWAYATKPQPRGLWPQRRLIWEASDPYLYLRSTPDGRIVVGGEDEEFSDEATRDRMLPVKIDAIRRKLSVLLPDIDATPDYAWTGCFGQSATGLPVIGEIPGLPRCYTVMGYGGNGITFSAIAAQIIQRKLAGLSDPDEDLFAVRSRS